MTADLLSLATCSWPRAMTPSFTKRSSTGTAECVQVLLRTHTYTCHEETTKHSSLSCLLSFLCNPYIHFLIYKIFHLLVNNCTHGHNNYIAQYYIAINRPAMHHAPATARAPRVCTLIFIESELPAGTPVG